VKFFLNSQLFVSNQTRAGIGEKARRCHLKAGRIEQQNQFLMDPGRKRVRLTNSVPENLSVLMDRDPMVDMGGVPSSPGLPSVRRDASAPSVGAPFLHQPNL